MDFPQKVSMHTVASPYARLPAQYVATFEVDDFVNVRPLIERLNAANFGKVGACHKTTVTLILNQEGLSYFNSLGITAPEAEKGDNPITSREYLTETNRGVRQLIFEAARALKEESRPLSDEFYTMLRDHQDFCKGDLSKAVSYDRILTAVTKGLAIAPACGPLLELQEELSQSKESSTGLSRPARYDMPR